MSLAGNTISPGRCDKWRQYTSDRTLRLPAELVSKALQLWRSPPAYDRRCPEFPCSPQSAFGPAVAGTFPGPGKRWLKNQYALPGLVESYPGSSRHWLRPEGNQPLVMF